MKTTVKILVDVEVEYSVTKIQHGEEFNIKTLSMKDIEREVESELYSNVADEMSDVVYFNWNRNENLIAN